MDRRSLRERWAVPVFILSACIICTFIPPVIGSQTPPSEQEAVDTQSCSIDSGEHDCTLGSQLINLKHSLAFEATEMNEGAGARVRRCVGVEKKSIFDPLLLFDPCSAIRHFSQLETALESALNH